MPNARRRWLKLYESLFCDPRLQRVAKRARCPAYQVLAVYITMMEAAHRSPGDWSAPDAAETCELPHSKVCRIAAAMEGNLTKDAVPTDWHRQDAKDDAGWCRLHHGAAVDGKWRVIAARVPGCRRSMVIAVFIGMLCRANASGAHDRQGSIAGWSDQVAGAVLGLAADVVESIRSSMEGLVLEGDRLTGWDTRQVARERQREDRRNAERQRNFRRKHPDRPRYDYTAAERKTRQRLKHSTNAQSVTGNADVTGNAHVTPVLDCTTPLPQSVEGDMGERREAFDPRRSRAAPAHSPSGFHENVQPPLIDGRRAPMLGSVRGGKAAPGLPDDWMPDEASVLAAQKLGHDRETIIGTVRRKFINKTPKTPGYEGANPDYAFRNWCEIEWKPNKTESSALESMRNAAPIRFSA